MRNDAITNGDQRRGQIHTDIAAAKGKAVQSRVGWLAASEVHNVRADVRRLDDRGLGALRTAHGNSLTEKCYGSDVDARLNENDITVDRGCNRRLDGRVRGGNIQRRS